MKKVFRFLKGVVKGARDASPVPSKEAERETISRNLDAYTAWYEQLGQRLTSRGIMVSVILYLIDQVFSLGLFS